MYYKMSRTDKCHSEPPTPSQSSSALASFLSIGSSLVDIALEQQIVEQKEIERKNSFDPTPTDRSSITSEDEIKENQNKKQFSNPLGGVGGEGVEIPPT